MNDLRIFDDLFEKHNLKDQIYYRLIMKIKVIIIKKLFLIQGA